MKDDAGGQSHNAINFTSKKSRILSELERSSARYYVIRSGIVFRKDWLM